MSFRRRAGGGKRDAVEAEIVSALEAVGARVWRVSGTSNPDLIVLWRGIWRPLEVKSGKDGRLTRNQQDLAWPVVRTVDEALAVIGGTRGGA